MSDITIFQFVNARTYIILLGQLLKSIKHHTLMFHLNMHIYILQTFIYSIVNCTIYTIIYMDFLPFFHLQSFFNMHLILMSTHTWKFSDISFDNPAESNIPFVGIETYSRYLQNTHTFSSRPRAKVAGVQYTDHSILYRILCIEVYFLKDGCLEQRPLRWLRAFLSFLGALSSNLRSSHSFFHKF